MRNGAIRGAPSVPVRRAASAGASLALVAALTVISGCGQRGPLTLPDSARPIERLDPTAQPPAQPEPDPEDDNTENKARQPENGR